MARNRMIKPDFWDDEKLATVSRDARLTYIGMWTASDDYGVTKGNGTWLKNTIFKYDQNLDTDVFEVWLIELESIGRIIPFYINSEKYYFMPKFLKHQKIDKPSKTRNPEPPENILDTLDKCSTVARETLASMTRDSSETVTTYSSPSRSTFPTKYKYKRSISEDKESTTTTVDESTRDPKGTPTELDILVKAIRNMATHSLVLQTELLSNGDLHAKMIKWREKCSGYSWIMYNVGILWDRVKQHIHSSIDPFEYENINSPLNYLYERVFPQEFGHEPDFNARNITFDERWGVRRYYLKFFGEDVKA